MVVLLLIIFTNLIIVFIILLLKVIFLILVMLVMRLYGAMASLVLLGNGLDGIVTWQNPTIFLNLVLMLSFFWQLYS